MKTPFLLLILVVSAACAKPRDNVLEPVESPPTKIGGLAISVVTQAEWRLPSGSRETSLVLQLRLENASEEAILFPTFDTFHPVLSDPAGKPVALDGGRDHTRITPKILLQPGASFSYELVAKLQPLNNGKGTAFIYQDHTGTWLNANIMPGKYSLHFNLTPTHNADLQKGLPDAPLWSAKGTTKAVNFQILPAG